jgi:superfamily II DNA or RNA helicase
MRLNKETIALLYQATGTGKTVTAVMDAKSVGGRVLFVAHTMELVNQAYQTFKSLWSEVTVGKFADSIKECDTHVVCGSIQSIALNLDILKDYDFDYVISLMKRITQQLIHIRRYWHILSPGSRLG